MSDYVVKFIKDERYRRFNVSGILTTTSRGICTLDLYEETVPLMTHFIIDENGNPNSEHEDGNLINYIHATMAVLPQNIPNIINSLQTMYDKYIKEQDEKSQVLNDG